MSTIDSEIALERFNLSQEEQEERADEWFSRKLDAGLFSLQVNRFFFFPFFFFLFASFSFPLGAQKRQNKKKKPPRGSRDNWGERKEKKG